MTDKRHQYVTQTKEGSWRVSGTRVSLDSVVGAYRQGQPPEVIAIWFPSLNLEQIHGVIAFYLRNRAEIDSYLTAQNARYDQLRNQSLAAGPAVIQRLRAAKQKQTIKSEPGH